MKWLAMIVAFMMAAVSVQAQDSSDEGVEAKAKNGWVEAKSPWGFAYSMDVYIGMNEVHKVGKSGSRFDNYTQFHTFYTSYKLDKNRKITVAVPFTASKSFKVTAPTPTQTPPAAPTPVDPAVAETAADTAETAADTAETADAEKTADTAATSQQAAAAPAGRKAKDDRYVVNSDGVREPMKDFSLGSAYIRYTDSALFSVGGNDVSGSVRLYVPTGALVNQGVRDSLPFQLRGDFTWSSELMSNTSLDLYLNPRIYRNMKGENGGDKMASVYLETGLSQSFGKSFVLGLSGYTSHAWKYKSAGTQQASTRPKGSSQGDEGTGPDKDQGQKTASTSSDDAPSHDFGLILSSSYSFTDDVSMVLAVDHSTPWKEIKFATDNATYYLGVAVSL